MKFAVLTSAVKLLKFKRIKTTLPQVELEKLVQSAIDALNDSGTNTFLSDTSFLSTINALQTKHAYAVNEVAKAKVTLPEKFAKLSIDLDLLKEFATWTDTFSTISAALALIDQGRTNTYWTKSDQQIAKDTCHQLGIK